VTEASALRQWCGPERTAIDKTHHALEKKRPELWTPFRVLRHHSEIRSHAFGNRGKSSTLRTLTKKHQ